MSSKHSTKKENKQPAHGLVIATYGRHYEVETSDNSIISCVMRGKKSGIAARAAEGRLRERDSVLAWAPTGAGLEADERSQPLYTLCVEAAKGRVHS